MKKYKVKRRFEKQGKVTFREDVVLGLHPPCKVGDGQVYATCPPVFETIISVELIEE